MAKRPVQKDPTIGADFTFDVLSHRFGRLETIGLRRTLVGWDVAHGFSGHCDRQGRPTLFKNLDHDSIEYPNSLGERIEHVWHEAQGRRLNKLAVQRALSALSLWVRHTECRIPNTPFWRPYKRRHPGISCGA